MACHAAFGDNHSRPHSCISLKFYSVFGLDGVVGNPEYDGGDTSDEDAPAACSTSTGATSATSSTALTTSIPATSSASSASALRRLPSVSSYSYLPLNIWDVPWVPSTGRYQGLFSSEMMAETVYDVATDNVAFEKLVVRGKDIAELVVCFKELLVQAADREDFTNILSPDRSFYM